MGLPKKIGIELLDNNIFNKIAGMIHGTTIAYDDTELNQEIDNLKLNKVSREELSAYFNKENERITREMLSSNLLDAIDTASVVASESIKIEENNLGPELSSRLNNISSSINSLIESKDKIDNVSQKADNIIYELESVQEEIDRLSTKASNLEIQIESLRNKNILTGCFVNSDEDLQDAVNRSERKIIDLKYNRILEMKNMPFETVNIPVSWDISDINNNVAGKYVINGVLKIPEGLQNLNYIRPQISVTINTDSNLNSETEPYITSITTEPLYVESEIGTDINILKTELPMYITLHVYDPLQIEDNEYTRTIYVAWDTSVYDPYVSGIQYFNGTFILPDGITNPHNIVPRFQVILSSDNMIKPNNIEMINEMFMSYIFVAGEDIQDLGLQDTCEVIFTKDFEPNIELYNRLNIYPLYNNSGYKNTLLINPITKKIFFFDGEKVYDMTPGD